MASLLPLAFKLKHFYCQGLFSNKTAAIAIAVSVFQTTYSIYTGAYIQNIGYTI